MSNEQISKTDEGSVNGRENVLPRQRVRKAAERGVKAMIESLEARCLMSVAASDSFALGLAEGTGLNGVAVSDTGFTGNYTVSQTASTGSYGSAKFTTTGLNFGGDPNAVSPTGAAIVSATSSSSGGVQVEQLSAPLTAALTGTVYMSYQLKFAGSYTGFGPSSNSGYTSVSVGAGGLKTAFNMWNNWNNSVGIGYGSVTAGTALNPVGDTPYFVLAKYTNVGTALSATTAGNANLWVFDSLSYYNWWKSGAAESTLGTYALATASATATSGTYNLNGSLTDVVNSGDIASSTINQQLDQFKAGSTLGDVTSAAWVPTLPNGVTAQDVGGSSPAGSSNYTGGTFTITGGGADIGGTSDQFQFASTGTSGNGSIDAHLVTQANTNTSAKAGVMARADGTAGSINAGVLRTPGNAILFQWRSAAGGATSSYQVSGITGPVYLRLSNTGTTWSGYYSTDGVTYTQVGSSATVAGLGSGTYLAGLAVTSHTTSAASAATFDSFTTPLNLISAGVVNYQVHLAQNADLVTTTAANELRQLLGSVGGGSGAAVSYDFKGTSGPQIIVGRYSQLTDVLGSTIDFTGLGSQGFVIKTVGPDIIIAGATSGGTQYGVTWFEDHILGVNWLTPTYTYIPSAPNLTIGAVQTKQIPRFDFRQVLGYEGQDKTFAYHNLLNGNTWGAIGIPNPTGTTNWDSSWGISTTEKSLGELAPSHTYGQQVLMMDSGTWTEMANNIISILNGVPNYQNIYFTVMNNDNPWSMDSASQAYANAHGGPAAPQLYMMTQVLNLVRASKPGAKIAYNAYQWGFTPPSDLTVPEGLMVIPMDIHVDESTPFNQGYNTKLGADLAKWNTITTDPMIIWDHTTNFDGFVEPTPNFYSIAQNIQWLSSQSNFRGYFAEDSHFTKSADFAALRTWLIARMTWDPTTDYNAAVGQWSNEYYGAAAGPLMKQYIDLTQAFSDSTGAPTWEKSAVTNRMFTLDYVRQADLLFDQATTAVAGNSVYLGHVNQARASLDFVILARRAEYTALAAQQGVSFNIDYTARLARLTQALTDNGVTYHSQGLNISDMNNMLSVTRTWPAADPSLVSGLPPSAWQQEQDLGLLRYWDAYNDFVADPLASDGVAAKIPANVKIHYKVENLPNDGGKYQLWAAVRADTTGTATGSTVAMVLGSDLPSGSFSSNVTVGQLNSGAYTYIQLGNGPFTYLNSDQAEVYVQGPSSSDITAAYIDRIIAVRIPDGPAPVTAVRASYNQINLSWKPVNGATSYSVYRSTTPGGEGATPIATGLTTPSFVSLGLSVSKTYYYKVTATNVAGTSVQSAEASATTDSTSILTSVAFNYPSIANGSSLSARGVIQPDDSTDYGIAGSYTVSQVSHTGSSGSATYSTAGLAFGSNFHALDGGAAVVSATAGPTGGSGQTEYLQATIDSARTGTVYMGYLLRFNGTTWQTGNSGYTQVSLAAGGLNSAFNMWNNWSNSVGVGYGTLTAGTTLNPTLATNYLVLARYTNVGTALSAGTPGNASLWVMTQTGYDNWFNAGAVESQLSTYAVATASATATSGTYNVSGTLSDSVNSGAAAYNSISQTLDGFRIGSSLADVTTAPVAPTGVAAVATSPNQINLSWAAVSGATSYNIYSSTTPGGEGATPIATGLTGTTFSSLALTPSTTYYYTVAAIGNGVVGSQSTEASAATLAPTNGTLLANLTLDYPTMTDGTALSGRPVVATGDITDSGFSGNYTVTQTGYASSSGSVTYASAGLGFGSHFHAVDGGAAVVKATSGNMNGTPQVENLQATTNTSMTGTVYLGYLLRFNGTTWQTGNSGYTQASLGVGGLKTAFNMWNNWSNSVGVGYGTLTAGTTLNPTLATNYLVLARYTNVGTALSAGTPGNASLWVMTQTGYDNWFNAGAVESQLSTYAVATASATATSGTYNFNGTLTNTVNSGNFAYNSIYQTLDGFRAGTMLSDVTTREGTNYINFNNYTVQDYSSGDQGIGGTVTKLDGGATLQIAGNGWKKIAINYTVTANTVLEFDYKSPTQGEIQGIGLDNDDTATGTNQFQLFGTQTYGIQTYRTYVGNGWTHYTINVGASFTGQMNVLTFINDDDALNAGVSLFTNVRLFES